MVKIEVGPDALDDVVAFDAVDTETVDHAGQFGTSHGGPAVEAQRLAEGFFDPALPSYGG